MNTVPLLASSLLAWVGISASSMASQAFDPAPSTVDAGPTDIRPWLADTMPVTLSGVSDKASVQKRIDKPGGRYAIHGTIEQAQGMFVLCGDRVSASGLAWTPQGQWRMVVRDGTLSTWELSPQEHPWTCDVANDLPGAGPPTDQPAGGVAGGCEEEHVIDVLMVVGYDTYIQMSTMMEDFTTLENEVDVIMEYANLPLINSNLDTRFNLVHAILMDSSEATPTLNQAALTQDGKADWIHPLRDIYGADLVQVLNVSSGGVAYLPRPNLSDNSVLGFSIASGLASAMGSPVSNHEIGHNLGCCHAPGDGGGCESGGYFDYSNGRCFEGKSGTRWNTIMAYDCVSTTAMAFSSPTVIWDGVPTGVDGSIPGPVEGADNARTIELLTPMVADYRCNDGICSSLGLSTTAADCNGNRIPDLCEIAHDPQLDSDQDGVLDSCTCTYDLNGDGAVNGGDLAFVLAGWGSTNPDLTGDGTVNGADLAVILAMWDSCP